MIFGPRDEWPELRVMFLPLPWTWRRPSLWRDDLTPTVILALGPLVLEWWG